MLQNEEVQMTMIEKMARAMYPQAFQDTMGEPPVVRRRVEEWRAQAFEKARAALEAIREPDRNVLSAMDAESYPDSGSYSRWQAGIDAMLSGEA